MTGIRSVPFLHGEVAAAGPGALAWAVLAAGVVMAAYGLRAGLRTPEGRAFFFAGLVAAAVSAAAVVRAAALSGDRAPLRNPVPPTAESVASGRRLYEVHCAVCHGAHGAGDGPAAAGLPRRPADLRLHVPMHPDGTLYAWITDGVPGTPMPPFRDRLTDEQRWHVVNYLRVLAVGAR